MSKILSIPTSNNFTRKLEHVYVSDDLCQHPDGSFTVKKWLSNYEKACPQPIEIHFPVSGKRPWHPFYINRYIPFSYFKSDIEKNAITFVSPLLWDDPFENVFYDENLTINGKKVDIRCICATYDYVDGEEAAWHRGKDNKDDKTVRVSLNFDKTCELFEKIGNNNNCDFYISVVDYSQSKDNLIKKNTPRYASVCEYIKIMSLKRKAFAYENELRIFAVFDNLGQDHSNMKDVIDFSLDPNDYNSIIEKVTLPPLSPFKRNDSHFKLYKTMQDNENLNLKTELQKLLPNSTINQSRLYMK